MAKMNEYRVGSLVRLINPHGSADYGVRTYVSVYFCEEDMTLKHGWLPANSIGIIVKEGDHAIVYTVLFGDRTILTSDTYINPYHGEELFMDYADYEGYISDMESAE